MRNQRGQATLEYILLLIVAVISLAAIVFAFSQSAKVFITNYYGAYFQCLLETGELPTLGNESNPNSTCNDEFQPFSFAKGRPPIDNSVNSANSLADTSNGSGAGKDKNAKADNVPAPGAAADAGSAGKFGSSFDDGSGRRNQAVPLSQAEKKNGIGSNEGRPAFNNFARGDGDEDDGGNNNRPNLVPAPGMTSRLREEEKQNGKVIAKMSEEESEKLTPRRVPADLEKKQEKIKEPDASLTFPDYIKFILIIGIIIVIVIFFGNQIMQFQKSQSD